MTPHPEPADADADADDLGWLAFCYVAGELDPAAEAAFEARLDHDQEAREAVADAVALSAAVAAAVPARLRIRRFRHMAAVAALAAACAAVVALPALRTWHPGAADGDPQQGLALAWSVLWQGADAADADEPDPFTAPSDVLVARLDEPGPPAEHPAIEPIDEPATPPSWMLEGVSLGEGLAPESPGS